MPFTHVWLILILFEAKYYLYYLTEFTRFSRFLDQIAWSPCIYLCMSFWIVLQWSLLFGGGVKKSDHCFSWRVSWAWQEQPASQISIASFHSWVMVRLLSSWASHVNQSKNACLCTVLWMSFYHC